MPIDSRDNLRRHLQTAIELEHSTLPPYLCALYSLADGTNAEARDVLQSVAIEEMLHLTLAANILNAVGGQPALDAPQLLPPHPTTLPHSNSSIVLSLRQFSKETLQGFMAVERPGSVDGAAAQDEGYATIGQFYRAIDEALVRISDELGEEILFSGDPERQVTDTIYCGGAWPHHHGNRSRLGESRIEGDCRAGRGPRPPVDLRRRQGHVPSRRYAGFRDPLPPELVDVDPLPWAEPGTADRGRERYAREQAALAAAKKER